MWFSFPEGTTNITVQQQSFGVEFENQVEEFEGKKKTVQYFRAPDHFAPIILELGGFKHVGQPEGAPDDLVVADPVIASVNSTLAIQLSAAQEENKMLREQLEFAAGSIRDLGTQLRAEEQKTKDLQTLLDQQAEAGVKGEKK